MQPLEFRRLSSEFTESLGAFFGDLDQSGIGQYFHPHPFTPAEAQRLTQYKGLDLYYVAVEGNRVLGYGLLRGWDEGHSIPSLGIALHPSAQGRGLGRAFMHFLHVAARQRGAVKVRLKVYPNNLRAVNLYASLGYVFQPLKEDGELVGVLDLA